MLHEPASTREDRLIIRAPQPPISQAELLHNEIRQKVATVLAIEQESFVEPRQGDEDAPAAPGLTLESHLVGTFEGQLLLESEAAYEKLDAELASINHIAVFRMTQGEAGTPPPAERQHTLHILTGRINPPPRPWWPNALLFVATVFSVLTVGTSLAINELAGRDLQAAEAVLNNFFLELWRGLPYAISILLILGAHELGHYFAGRRHKLAVTLPYFIPLPSIFSMFGTMGAFIQLRQPMRNRKTLFDIGAAGPLAGLIFAVPILFIGLANTRTIQITGTGVYEGDSILYATAKVLTYGQFLPNGRIDVCVDCNQMLWAGWTGLLVTALNLIPVGQLDGGHVLYALIGERARRLYYPLLVALAALALVANVWFIWVMLILFFGRMYATPLDMITPLDGRRR
ncbi:MAG: site-2 protease family protein, partial [Anaerolineae bacterium]|nr:site-2 protease family protein [Anaerolineae bacterium]